MSRHGEPYDKLSLVTGKLYMLRGSCEGIFKAETYNPGYTWFEGAATICNEALHVIEDTLARLEKEAPDAAETD